MKTKRVIWTIVFLSITLAAIVMEVIAGIFHPAGTIPWTEYLARYVPWPIQLLAYVILAVWLPFHFWRHDHLRKVAYREGLEHGRMIGYRDGRQDGDRVQHGHRPACCSHGRAWGALDHECDDQSPPLSYPPQPSPRPHSTW